MAGAMSCGEETAARRLAAKFLREQPLPMGAEHDCPYLPGRIARCEGFYAEELHPEVYAALMDHGFRRSGKVIYRAACPSCTACRQLRVPVADFHPSRSQRRVLRRNQDIEVTVDRPSLTKEKWLLFAAYLDAQHDRTMPRSLEALADFLYNSSVGTVEIAYRLGEELVAVSLADRSREALSSVYVYFAPQHGHRSLGTFSALWEIEYCRRLGIPYYYLGYYVADAKTMNYKVRFQPCEILDEGGTWVWPVARQAP